MPGETEYYRPPPKPTPKPTTQTEDQETTTE
jgi:hypothetical protein